MERRLRGDGGRLRLHRPRRARSAAHGELALHRRPGVLRPRGGGGSPHAQDLLHEEAGAGAVAVRPRLPPDLPPGLLGAGRRRGPGGRSDHGAAAGALRPRSRGRALRRGVPLRPVGAGSLRGEGPQRELLLHGERRHPVPERRLRRGQAGGLRVLRLRGPRGGEGSRVHGGTVRRQRDLLHLRQPGRDRARAEEGRHRLHAQPPGPLQGVAGAAGGRGGADDDREPLLGGPLPRLQRPQAADGRPGLPGGGRHAHRQGVPDRDRAPGRGDPRLHDGAGGGTRPGTTRTCRRRGAG